MSVTGESMCTIYAGLLLIGGLSRSPVSQLTAVI